jgi:hypothetical protein
MRQLDRRAACQGDITFARKQALRCQMDGHERRAAGGLHVDARTLEVEQVRDPRREEVLVVARMTDEEEPG